MASKHDPWLAENSGSTLIGWDSSSSSARPNTVILENLTTSVQLWFPLVTLDQAVNSFRSKYMRCIASGMLKNKNIFIEVILLETWMDSFKINKHD